MWVSERGDGERGGRDGLVHVPSSMEMKDVHGHPASFYVPYPDGEEI